MLFKKMKASPRICVKLKETTAIVVYSLMYLAAPSGYFHECKKQIPIKHINNCLSP